MFGGLFRKGPMLKGVPVYGSHHTAEYLEKIRNPKAQARCSKCGMPLDNNPFGICDNCWLNGDDDDSW